MTKCAQPIPGPNRSTRLTETEGYGVNDERQRVEAIGALASGVAHEINTPIQFIGDNLIYLQNVFAELIPALNHHDNEKINTPDLTDIESAIRESMEGVEQIRDIVVVMKNFACSGGGEAGSADLNDILENVVKVCRGRGRDLIRIELDLDPELPLVRCRPAQIQQAFVNIVMNAIDALEKASGDQLSIAIQSEKSTDAVRLSFSDQGIGICDEIRHKIFHPFFTTKPAGAATGNGLSLARDIIVNGHGGKLVLGERPGYATCFVMTLPIKNAEQSTAKEETGHASTD